MEPFMQTAQTNQRGQTKQTNETNQAIKGTRRGKDDQAP
jgi:hypothetical protein